MPGEVLLPRNNRRFKGRKYNQPRAIMPHASDRTTMLNLGRLSAFRYDIKEIMRRYEIEEGAARSVMASVIAKSSRISIVSAMDYVREQEKSGAYPREALEEICDLLDRFSKLR
jgi:hypothetical protein